MDRDEIKKFEDGFKDGVYAIPSDPSVKVKVRALFDYLKKIM